MNARVPKLLSFGYGVWPAARRPELIPATLTSAGVEVVIDIRHSPCPSQTSLASNYGPRDWHLRPAGAGIVPLLARFGIGYRWVVELGNPQKSDPAMAVLREHLADRAGDWPVHRGLRLVADRVEAGAVVALMCACEKYADCHRRLVVEALVPLLPVGTTHRDLTG